MSFFENTRNPVGLGGKIMVALMNLGHSPVARWGLRFLELTPDAKVLDCGCGGGANIKRLLKLCPKGTVRGIDYSPVSVEKSKKVNKAAVARGRCDVLCASVAELPFESEQFDLVTAFETVYFWPDLPRCFCEVGRVLKPGGTFCGCFYVKGEQKRTDWFVRHIYEKAGFFTPPYETVSSLKARLDGMYADVDMGNLKSMAWFVCRKAG